MQLLHLLVLLTILKYGSGNPPVDPNFKESMNWIEQKLDHFNESDKRTWKMRYLASADYFKPGGPLIISVSGEWTIHPKESLTGYYYELSRVFHGYSTTTEHRYYGESRPVANMTTENLKYLTVRQAMADVAHFIRFMKSTVRGLKDSKVILLGCSYAGTLVIWLKREYPDLIDGIWASGAPVFFRMIYADGFIGAGQTIKLAGGDACYDRINNMTAKYSYLLESNDTKVLPLMKSLNLLKYLNLTQEIITTNTQHRNLTTLKKFCNQIVDIGNDDIVGFGKFLEVQFKKLPPAGSVSNILFSNESIERQWLYQCCNELGLLDVTNSVYQPFGNMLPLTKLTNKCKQEFGDKYTIEYINKKVDEINEYFGGYEPGIQNAYYTYSEHDPIRYTGMYDKGATVIPEVGHCQELRNISNIDLPATVAAKKKAIELIRSWIS